MRKPVTSEYERGPSACLPQPAVLRSVRKQIRESRSLSRGDVRLASAMGLIAADVRKPIGYNDGVFYPVYDNGPQKAEAKLRPSKLLKVKSTKRKLHALALLVDFADNVGARPASEFAKLLFDANDPNSMTSYYRDVSYGELDVTGEVVGYIRAPHPYSYYTNGESGTGDSVPNNTPGLLLDVLKIFTQSRSLSQFDTDGDGHLDGIFLIHAGGGAEAEPNPEARKHKIWSHKWVLPQPFVSGGVKVYAYSTEPEDGRVGVFAHEFGHVLGLPDLYDASYRSRGVGDWCLMGGGSWGGGGDQPTRMSCWCLAELGWIKTTSVAKATTLTLDTLANDRKACYRIWSKGKNGPEYFLVENRQALGRDAALPGSGLALWHIDETQSDNAQPPVYKVALTQADGEQDLENDANGGDDADLFPGRKQARNFHDATIPSAMANNGLPTGIALTKIEMKNARVSFKVKV
jgi:immune inhibitor A